MKPWTKPLKNHIMFELLKYSKYHANKILKF